MAKVKNNPKIIWENALDQVPKTWDWYEKELNSTEVHKDIVGAFACPFPNHKGYREVRGDLTQEQQQYMEENIKITDDGKIEIIKMKKKFSLLAAEQNGKDIVDGNHIERYGSKTWIPWVTYLNYMSAKKECRKQHKKILENKSAAMEFINCFPWNEYKDKIYNFVKLFDLEKSGLWDIHNQSWSHEVGFMWFITLSDSDNHFINGVCWVRRDDEYANFTTNLLEGAYPDNFLSPFLAYEDC